MPPADLAHRIQAIRSTAEVIAQSLREMICQAELPPGEPLIQERIAEMFQVSRVPVRDALQLLIGMGVAVSVPRRGVIVRPLSRKHIDDLYEVRKILEAAAIREVVRHPSPDLHSQLSAVIRQQGECLDSGDVKRQAALDDAFHGSLFDALRNDRLRELIRSTWEMIRQARCASVVAPRHGLAWIGSSIERHTQILGALSGGEAAAVSAVCDSVESSKQEILQSLREMQWLDGSNGTPARVPGRSGGGRPRRG
ncbi:MAG: GntR family transcriptional regulator [Candidatus Methylomirabilota bacterium]